MTKKVNLIKGINWNDVTVSTKKHNGTLAECNVAVLPAKKDCAPNAWNALGCLSSAWKAYIRLVSYPKDAARHEDALRKALSEYCAYSGVTYSAWLHNIIVSVLNVHYNKKADAFSATSELCFKKNVIRITMRIQAGTFSVTNQVKGDTVKVSKTFNINDLTPEMVCKILGIDEEVYYAMMNKKAQ